MRTSRTAGKIGKWSQDVGRVAVLIGLLILPSTASAVPLLINNGLAPPNPANVIAGTLGTVGLTAPEVLAVRNQNCPDPTAVCASPGDPTGVEIAPGADVWGAIDVRDSSQLLMTGGSHAGNLDLHDSASLTVTGAPGSASWIRAFDDSSVTVANITGSIAFLGLSDSATGLVQGGGFSNGVVTDGASSLTYSGLGSDSMQARDTSSILMTGGGTNTLRVRESASVVMTGGTVSDRIATEAQGKLRIEGGAAQLPILEALGTSVIRIAGSNFAVDGVPVGFGLITAQTGVLTGTLLSGQVFSTGSFFHNGFTTFQTFSGSIVLTPEPGTALLLGLGLVGLALRRSTD